MPAEPVSSRMEHTGSRASTVLDACVRRASAWAGESLRALILSGSHASGEAVWAEVNGVAVSLSDVDLYAVLGDDDACRAAAARASADRARGAARVAGLAAPLEVAFLTEPGLARFPARPATLELRRHGRVVAGDPAVLERLPHWRAQDVSHEETLLLIENRAFELLLAEPGATSGDRLTRLLARHAVLKVALDLAGAAALEAGEWPDGAAARLAWWRSRRAGEPRPESALEPVWPAALAWRAGAVEALDPAAADAEWRTVARAWCTAWLAHAPLGPPADPWRRVAALAARAPLRRRLRQALAFRARTGSGPALLARLAYAIAGTPQHRVHAAAGVLLLAAAAPPDDASARALARLGVVPGAVHLERDAAVRQVVGAWDRWLLDGLRTAVTP